MPKLEREKFFETPNNDKFQKYNSKFKKKKKDI